MTVRVTDAAHERAGRGRERRRAAHRRGRQRDGRPARGRRARSEGDQERHDPLEPPARVRRLRRRRRQAPAADTTAPTATILGIRDGQRFTRRRAPRELRGRASADPSGLWAVKIRLTRRLGGTCWYFSGSKERFLKRTCGKQHAFKVAEATDWSYLLPARLPRGRYVLDTYAIDRAFNRGAESRVVFRVR